MVTDVQNVNSQWVYLIWRSTDEEYNLITLLKTVLLLSLFFFLYETTSWCIFLYFVYSYYSLCCPYQEFAMVYDHRLNMAISTISPVVKDRMKFIRVHSVNADRANCGYCPQHHWLSEENSCSVQQYCGFRLIRSKTKGTDWAILACPNQYNIIVSLRQRNSLRSEKNQTKNKREQVQIFNNQNKRP